MHRDRPIKYIPASASSGKLPPIRTSDSAAIVHDPETPCVYARKDSPYWWYRFSIRGEPFQASTKVTKKAANKAAAERVAAAERARLMAEVLQ